MVSAAYHFPLRGVAQQHSFILYNVYSHLGLVVRFTEKKKKFKQKEWKLYLSSGIAPCRWKTDGARIHFSQISLCRFRIPNTYFSYSHQMTRFKQVMKCTHQETI
jgi:hypothetical protein